MGYQKKTGYKCKKEDMISKVLHESLRYARSDCDDLFTTRCKAIYRPNCLDGVEDTILCKGEPVPEDPPKDSCYWMRGTLTL